jgi:hypothetical protein
MAENSPITVSFERDSIRFLSYPYPPSSVYPSGKSPYFEIREFDSGATPPEVRTARGEILFIPAAMKEELRSAASGRGVPQVSRIDVWGLLLEPFLDTEFSPEHTKRTFGALEESGISRDESEEIRAFVAAAMMAYNFDSMLWDWCHLGLSDVLNALLGVLSGRRHKLAPKGYEEFYWRAMELAGRGRIID